MRGGDREALVCGSAGGEHAPVDETLPASDKRQAPEVGRIVAGRYRLDSYLGRGGSGTVFRATDLLADGCVAVKLLRDVDERGRARVRREIGLLRALRVPGVVHLLDDGVEHDAHFLVMDYVEGSPFPGDGFDGRWELLQPLVVGLLETLRRVHARGVVHRDLKPANILVDSDGRVRVLDFGLSVGPTLGQPQMERGFVYGTPAYLAPEQVRGGVAAPQTDLYAVGVLIYEALSGRLPHAVGDMHRLIAAKVSTVPLPLDHHRPDLPAQLTETVDALLRIDSADRPSSARRVLGLLTGESSPPRASTPWLGPRDAVDAVVAAAHNGQQLDVVGGRGTGKTRVLLEARAALEAGGMAVLEVGRGERPFESLGRLADMPAPAGSGELAQFVADHLCGAVGDAVLFVDDAELVDRWSARVLELVRDRISVIRTRRTAGAWPLVQLRALRQTELVALFAVSSRFGSLSADAAEELFRRTGGQQAAVVDEIGCWVRAGVAHLDGTRITVFRAALDRFRAGLELGPPVLDAELAPDAHGELHELLAWLALAWPCTDLDLLSAVMGRPVATLREQVLQLVDAGLAEWEGEHRVRPTAVTWTERFADDAARAAAHSLVANALPPGAHGRLLHLIACDDAVELAEEARVVAVNLRNAGQSGQAIEALAEGVRALRRAKVGGSERLLREWLITALWTLEPRPLDRILHELSRISPSTAIVSLYDRFARAAQVARLPGGERGIAMLEALGPVDDPELERWRLSLQVHCAFRLPVERESELFHKFERWCDGQDDPELLVTLAQLEGRLRYGQARYADAARCQERAAELAPGPPRPGLLLNQATAWLEALEFGAAMSAARAARAAAREGREAMKEAKAEFLIRAASYRRGSPLTVDESLVEAVAEVGVPYLEALIALTEAAVAWRTGEAGVARELADRSAALWRTLETPCGAHLAEALSMLNAGEPDVERLRLLAQLSLSGDDLPRLRAQTLGLLALAQGTSDAVWQTRVQQFALDVDPDSWHRRLEVVSIEEALAAVATGL